MTEWLMVAMLKQALLMSAGIVLILALRPLLLRRLGATASYAAWLLVPTLLVTPVLPRPTQEPLRVLLTAPAAASIASVTAARPLPGHSAADWALALWLAGAVAVVAVQARRQRRLSRCGAHLPAGSSPALVGLLRPRVLLPADFEQRFSAEERQLILAHEAVHQRRHDNAWNALACALTALHWWNPLSWLAWRRMQADQELACDAAVLAAHPAARASYIRALLAAHGLRSHSAPLASRWVSAHPLVERIAMLTQPQAPRARRATLLTLLIAAVAGLSYAAQAEAPPGASGTKVDYRLELSVVDARGGTTNTYSMGTPRLIGPLGGAVSVGVAPKQDGYPAFEIKMLTTQEPNGELSVTTTWRSGEPLAALPGSHTQKAVTDQPFEMRRPLSEGGPVLVMKRVVRLLPPDPIKPPQ